MPHPGSDDRFRLTESQARDLAEAFGTPLYVVDEGHFRARIRRYRAAFAAAEPNGEITFASKANSTLAILAIAHHEGCLIDVASEGEFRAALLAGVPPGRCHLHGNNKSAHELRFAFETGIGQIVVDNFAEIETIAELAHHHPCPELVLRLAPGVDPITHAKISTGQADTKFGFNVSDGSAERATRRILDHGLPLAGFHCHVGSQLLDPEAQVTGGQIIAEFAVRMRHETGFAAKVLNVGGGLGIRYTDADQPMAVEDYCAAIVRSVRGALEGTGLTPRLVQEPGRSLVGESGVTLYTVGVIKRVPAKEIGTRTYVSVDGGLSDNPRPALYGSPYPVERVSPANDAPAMTVTVSGKHCETDRLFPDIGLPNDLREGDLLQVLCTGAYNSAMASNYNRYPRPATVLLTGEGPALVQRRESWEELFSREAIPASLARETVTA
ncbi:MAG: diaminopimelate decarboxylase [Fimbriimonadaceae bacterium]|nr:diaminopimelate decarboxylase [Fimbriimonadaceae bacterium]